MVMIYNSTNIHGETQKEILGENSEYKKLEKLKNSYKKNGFKTWINPYDNNNWVLTAIKKGS